jgi:hypothetical protein
MNKITKNDLLKLKDSKAVPITAHSHEVIVPVVFASKVNKFLEKEGIKLPLTHHQLSEYKKKAAKLKGKYEEDIKECDEGNSHEKGTHNIKGSRNIKVSNVKGSVYINTYLKKAKKGKGRGKILRKGRIVTSATGLIQPPETSVFKNRIQPPPPLAFRPSNNTFAMIRPQGTTYSANTPTLQDIQKEIQTTFNKEKEAVDKQVEKLETEGKERKKHIDDLERALEKEQRNEARLIHSDTRLNTESASASASAAASSSSAGFEPIEDEDDAIEIGKLRMLAQEFGVPITLPTQAAAKKTSQQLYDELLAKNPAILSTFRDAYATFSKAGHKPATGTRLDKIIAKMKELNPALFA